MTTKESSTPTPNAAPKSGVFDEVLFHARVHLETGRPGIADHQLRRIRQSLARSASPSKDRQLAEHGRLEATTRVFRQEALDSLKDIEAQELPVEDDLLLLTATGMLSMVERDSRLAFVGGLRRRQQYYDRGAQVLHAITLSEDGPSDITEAMLKETSSDDVRISSLRDYLLYLRQR